VAIAVVDVLEVIEVEHHARQLLSVALRPLELDGEELQEAPAIGDASERIGPREIAKPALT
jgi:hypothetical protein